MDCDGQSRHGLVRRRCFEMEIEVTGHTLNFSYALTGAERAGRTPKPENPKGECGTCEMRSCHLSAVAAARAAGAGAWQSADCSSLLSLAVVTLTNSDRSARVARSVSHASYSR